MCLTVSDYKLQISELIADDRSGFYNKVIDAIDNNLQTLLSDNRISDSTYSALLSRIYIDLFDKSSDVLINIKKSNSDLEKQQQELEIAKVDLDIRKQELEIGKIDVDIAKQKLATQILDKELTNQKIITEKFQTQDVVQGNPIKGVMGAEKKVKEYQVVSWNNSEINKAASVWADIIKVRLINDSNINIAGTGLEDTNVKEIMDKYKSVILNL